MRKFFTLMLLVCIALSGSAQDTYVVKSSDNGVLTAGQVLSNTGTAITVSAALPSKKNKDMKSGRFFSDGTPAQFFCKGSATMRLKNDPTEGADLEPNAGDNCAIKVVVNETLDSLKFYSECGQNKSTAFKMMDMSSYTIVNYASTVESADQVTGGS